MWRLADPPMIGWVKDLAGFFTGGLHAVAGLLVRPGVVTLLPAGSLRRAAVAAPCST